MLNCVVSMRMNHFTRAYSRYMHLQRLHSTVMASAQSRKLAAALMIYIQLVTLLCFKHTILLPIE
jgi:hypothetical protein